MASKVVTTLSIETVLGKGIIFIKFPFMIQIEAQ